MHRRAAAAVLVLGLVAGPVPAVADDDPPAAPPGSAPEAADPATGPAADPAEAFAAEMAALVERIRGLPFREKVARDRRTREELRRELLPDEGPDGDAPDASGNGDGSGKKGGNADDGPSQDTRVLTFLGLLPEKAKAEEAQARFTAEAAAGYYDSSTRTFTIVEDARTHLNRMVVFHELVHAVEDQHYGLKGPRSAYRRERRSDHVHAWKALVEGSAQLFTDRYLDSEEGLRTAVAREVIGTELPWKRKRPGAKKEESGEAGEGKDGKAGEDEEDGESGEDGEETPGPAARRPAGGGDLSSQPAYLVIRNGMFYYHNGARFLAEVLETGDRKEGDPDPLAAVYADPPVSTEMILHPRKYLPPRDLPREVVLPDVAARLGEGWSRVAVDTLGELGTGLAINRWRFHPETRMQLLMVLKVPKGGFRRPEDLLDTPMAFTGDTARAVEGWDGDRIAIYARGEETCAVWVLVWDSPEDAEEFATLYVRLLPRKYEKAAEGEDSPRTAVVADGDRVIIAERIPAAALDGVVEALRATEVRQDPADALPMAAHEGTSGTGK